MAQCALRIADTLLEVVDVVARVDQVFVRFSAGPEADRACRTESDPTFRTVQSTSVLHSNGDAKTWCMRALAARSGARMFAGPPSCRRAGTNMRGNSRPR